MRRALRGVGIAAALSALPLVLGFGLCGPSFTPPPEPRGCTTPAAVGVVTALEVGAAEGTFEPGSRATPMTGGQGLDMLGYRIGVRATESVDCIALTGGNLTVEPSGGWYVTDPIWEVLRGTTSIAVVAEGYGMRVERVMSASGRPVDGGGPTDATIDAPP